MLTIGAAPLKGFDEPLGLMSDCHRRIEKFLAQLATVVQRAAGRALAPAESEALDGALRYFAGMATLHTADEEQSLLPRMAPALAGQPERLAELASLETDHVRVGALHAEIDTLARAWLRGEVPSAVDAARLERLCRELQAAYDRHIAFEDGALYPLAASLLSAADLAAIGDEMAERRGRLSCTERRAAESA